MAIFFCGGGGKRVRLLFPTSLPFFDQQSFNEMCSMVYLNPKSDITPWKPVWWLNPNLGVNIKNI